MLGLFKLKLIWTNSGNFSDSQTPLHVFFLFYDLIGHGVDCQCTQASHIQTEQDPCDLMQVNLVTVGAVV